MFENRLARVRDAMDENDVDVLLLAAGPDLRWLSGYDAMPLERITMLVVPRAGEATLVVPRLEVARVTERPEAFTVRPFEETDDPIGLVRTLAGSVDTAAISDRTWARFVLELQAAFGSGVSWRKGSTVTGPLRAVKDPVEIEALRLAGAAADRVATQLQGGHIPLVGRTEAEVSADIGRRLIHEGHERVNFAIVAAGANAASPHHEAGERRIAPGDVVLCDFGGTYVHEGVGYCSDITRCVSVGEPAGDVAAAYEVLHDAQAAAVAAATVGTPCEDVDATARRIIDDAGYGPRFFHRVGHGIGVEEHEDPYMVAGNDTLIEAGHAFSVEPGIYTAGAWGLRLEDIVVATDDGPEPLNRVDHGLVAVDG